MSQLPVSTAEWEYALHLHLVLHVLIEVNLQRVSYMVTTHNLGKCQILSIFQGWVSTKIAIFRIVL